MFHEMPLLPAQAERISAAVQVRNESIFNQSAATLRDLSEAVPDCPLEVLVIEARMKHLSERLDRMARAEMVVFH